MTHEYCNKIVSSKRRHVKVVELKNNKSLICRAVQKLHRLELLDETYVDQILANPPYKTPRLGGLSDSPEEVGKTDRNKAFSS